jgi:ABC-type sugar transport system ATPase subunit
VTHDQEEALAVSDRIAVMNGGVIQQIDTPKNVYQRPSNIFVSTFIGLSNIMDGRIEAKDGQTFLHIGDYSVPMENLSRSADDGQAVKVSIRPEDFIINREGSDGIPAVVRSSVFLGITTHYFVETVTAGRWRLYKTPISGILSRTTPPFVWAYSPIKSTYSLRTEVIALLSGGTIHEICGREKIKYMGCNGTGNPGPVPSLRGLSPGSGAL